MHPSTLSVTTTDGKKTSGTQSQIHVHSTTVRTILECASVTYQLFVEIYWIIGGGGEGSSEKGNICVMDRRNKGTKNGNSAREKER